MGKTAALDVHSAFIFRRRSRRALYVPNSVTFTRVREFVYTFSTRDLLEHLFSRRLAVIIGHVFISFYICTNRSLLSIRTIEKKDL